MCLKKGFAMELCLNSRKNRIALSAYSSLGFGLGLFLVVLAIFCLLNYPIDALLCISSGVLLLTGCSICGLFLFLFIVLSREYLVDTGGITIRYFKRHSIKYPWKDVGTIIVCDVNHAPKNPDNFDLVIRMSVGAEKNGPSLNNDPMFLSSSNHWRRSEYGIIHFQKIILIEYSESRLAQIREMSQRDIVYLLTMHGKKRIQNC